jgi:hypothetical protein
METRKQNGRYIPSSAELLAAGWLVLIDRLDLAQLPTPQPPSQHQATTTQLLGCVQQNHTKPLRHAAVFQA